MSPPDCHGISLRLDVRRRWVADDGGTLELAWPRVAAPLERETRTRDAVARIVYARTFAWLERTLNGYFATDVGASAGGGAPQAALASLRYIGLLDIFGFERFELNSFEQLCINFANEVLQFFFNERVFVEEQEYYKDEGVTLQGVIYTDNNPILELISKPPDGILHLLDQQCKMNQSNCRAYRKTVS